jgi:hypothetical protein
LHAGITEIAPYAFGSFSCEPIGEPILADTEGWLYSETADRADARPLVLEGYYATHLAEYMTDYQHYYYFK